MTTRLTFRALVPRHSQSEALLATTATANKTSLKNKHLLDGDFFAIIAFCSHCIIVDKLRYR